MKSIVFLFTLVPSLAFAKFDLNNVESIACEDAAPTAEMNITFETYGDGPSYVKRVDDMIPYRYENHISKNTPQDGIFKVVEDPSQDSDTVVLQDDFLAPLIQRLVLVPGKTTDHYMGYLSGHVELDSGAWVDIENYAMTCYVSTPRIPHMGGPLQ